MDSFYWKAFISTKRGVGLPRQRLGLSDEDVAERLPVAIDVTKLAPMDVFVPVAIGDDLE